MVNGLSIIVLNYENPDRLKNCLHAIRSQKYPQKEVQIIVIDDGSKTDIKPVCDEYDAEFYTWPHSINIGKLFNEGFAKAKYETLVLLTQDHILSDDFLEKLTGRMGNNILFGAKILDSNGNLYYAAQFRADTAIPNHFDGFGVAISKHNCPLFDTTEQGRIYQHCNPRWLDRVKAMGVDMQYHEDLIITHIDHARRGD